jgi:uncharacterized membrane protein YphA (DoxX/SURF4 family)
MPLLTRLLIVAVLLPLGWRLAFSTVPFSPAESARLQSMGVTDAGVDFARVRSTLPGSASEQQPAPTSAPAAGTPLSEGRALYRVSLTADAAGFPAPALAGWLTAVLLLGGSVLVGAGAFTRLTAALLALLSATAFWVDCLPAIRGGYWSLDSATLVHAGAHLALFILCANLLCLGGGALCVDALLAGGGGRSAKGGGNRGGGGRKAGGESRAAKEE